MRSKISIVVIALCLVFGMAFTAYAAPMPDIEKHWAKEQINAWVGKGLINGYEDGTFRPDNNITRAEFMALVNRAFNYQEKVEIDYKDVADTAWYADLIKIAQAAGYISGYEDGTMKPNNPISRQEAATIIMKILGLEENSPGADRFKDATSIPAWSKGAVGAVASSGIMGGYPDGTFKAVNLIKRAEAVVALDKALKADVIYDKAGTYGPASGSEEISGNVIISAANVTLQNLVIEGNLTIDEAVGNGDVHLKQVTVKGDTYIYGGGKDSVYFIDCQTGKTYVLKDDGPVRIVVSGTTEINEIIAQSGLTVEEVNLTGEGIEGITVDKKVDGNIEINLRGVEVESLEINTEGVTVRTDRNTVIDKLVANEKTDFKGSGTIKDADINADGVTFDKMPDKYELAENVKQPTRSSSGGGGGSSKVAVSAISVEGDAVVGATLTAEVTPSGATVNYQWQRADDGATWNDIADATSKTYILSENEVGKLIRVKVTGTGNYTGTKISEAVGPVTDAPEPEVKGSIARDPGNTGGKDLTVTVDGETITFNGEIEWYPADESVGRNEAGNRVGVEITAPEGFDASGAVVTIGDDTYENLFTAEKNYFWWYPLVTQAGQQFTATVVWNESSTQVFTVKIADTAKLEKAPVEEVTRTAAPTQDPGNTGGDLEYNFADGTLTISGTIADIPESTNPAGVTAKWIGVNIPKPTTDVADAGTIHLTIKEAGKEPVVHESVSYGEGDPFLYYFGAQAGGRSITLEIVWNGKHKETLVIEYVDTTEPEPEVKGSIARDPGNTGGKDLTVTVDGETITFNGEIEWYPADESVGRNEAGNRVGVEITAPEGFDASGAVVTIGDDTYENLFTAEKNYFWWYPLVTQAGQQFTATVVWNESSTQVFTVKIADTAKLEKAPVEEVTRTAAPTQDPGNTGGDLEYNFADGTLTISGTIADIPESTNPAGVTAKWIGVNIPKPTTDVADAGTIHLTIKEAGKEPVVHESVSYGEGDPFLYYFGAQAGGRSITLEIVWNGKHKETLVIEYVDTTEPEPEVKGSIARDPGNTGGKDLTVTVDGETITFDGNIEWYPVDESVGRNEAGNRVGVEITAPEGFDASGAVVTIGDDTYENLFTAEKNYFWWYPLVTQAGQQFTATVVWNESSTQVFTVKIADTAKLEKAPVEEVTRTAAPTQDPGNTGGDLEYNFADGTLTISGTIADIPESTNPAGVTAKWIGVNIPKPTTDVADAGTIHLTIKEAGKEPVVHESVSYGEGDPFLYYFGAQAGGRSITLEIVWNGKHKETLVIEYVDTTEPEPEVKGSIARDPGNTGGKDLTVTVDGETITFDGNIEWYPVDESVGRNEAGNRVGVEITAPEGFDASGAVVTIGDDTYENLFTAEKNYFWWYPLVTQAGQQFTATVVWNESSTQVFTVKIADTAKLEKAPVEEVTRTAAPTQDPGNTGGDLEYNFADGTLTISGTIADIPESTNPAGVTAKWIGVNIPKPTTDVADAGTIHLTIKEAGKEPVVHESVSYGEGDPFLYYFGAQAGGRSITLEIVWNGKHKETLVIEYVDTTEPEPEVKGSIARDPGNTGGKDLTVTVDGETITFDGNIEWYPVDESVGRNEAGNRVGVEITAPEGFDASGAVVTIGDDTYENLFTAEKNYFWWYPLVTQAGQQFTATVVWNESSTQVFTVKIADTAKLEKAPVEEVTRTAAPTQDPGNTGGDLEYNFADGTLTISGTIADIPESTNPAGVTAKWIGVNIPKPTTDVADAGTIHLTIKEAGKEPVVHESVSYGEGDPFLYYFGAQAGGRSITLEIVWNGKHKETLVIEYVDTTEPEPEVKGSIARDPGKTGGKDLDVDIDGNTITFDGNIEWYPADPDVGRNEAGNRVGVEIIAPEGFDASGAVVTIDGEEYNDLFTAEKNYFWWYPLVSEAGETFTATVVWNEVSTQVFKVVIGENVTLEPAPDNTAPKLVGVSPEAGEVNLEYDETFKLEVTASDENLYELEVDHSMEATLPEFSVYADADNPYGDSASEFAEAGVEVIYDAEEQKWTIDFGEEVTNQIVDNEGITFYLVLVDEAGNKWGSMDPTTEENTFAYTVTQEPAPEASTYKFSYEVPEEVIAGEEYTVPVTIEPETVGDFGYDKVRFNVEVTTPDGATLQLLAEDTNGVEHDVAAIGYWGPENGFTIDANYSEATDFRAIFSAAGKYSITFSLVDLDADKVLITETVEITAEPTQEEIDAAKADFLADLKNKVKDIDVAAVAIDEENITVTFDRDTTPSAVYQAANELVAALKGELEAAKLTLDEEESFDLTEEDVAAQIALYLLDGTSPQDFLKGKEAVEASYTAEATNEDGITFTLEGELVFKVAEPTQDEIDAAKAAFLDYLEGEVEDIEVADVEIVGEDITVTFNRDTTPSAVYQAANELVEALKGELEAAKLTLDEEESFDLTEEDVAAQIALYLLDGTSPQDFLKGKEAVEASYTAEATNEDGITFTLEG